MQLNVKDMNGKEVGQISLDDAVFNKEYKEALIHQVVVAQLANRRQGTHSALTRREVAGGGIKPFRQKGTGRARQGSSRSPQHVGGGIVFAKKPRDFSQKINKSMKKAAFLSAISEKIRQSEVTVLDKLALKEAKTKLFQNVINALKLDGKVIFVTDSYDETLIRAIKNIPDAQVQEARTLSVYDIVANRNLVFTKSAIEQVEEANK
ncbi:MAG: 50S ribosomal protein L4 [Christensenellales bacterium]